MPRWSPDLTDTELDDDLDYGGEDGELEGIIIPPRIRE